MKFALTGSIATTLVLMAVSAHAGAFTLSPFTGDADSGITADSAYTHAINVAGSGNLTVNGAVFTGPGAVGNPSTNNYSVGSNPNVFTGFATPVTGNIGTALSDFTFNGNPATVTLNNLRVGQAYESVFYNTAFGAPGGRLVTVTANGADSFLFDENATPGSLLTYGFTATSSTMTFALTPSNPADTFHTYAFTNRMVGYQALFTDNFYAPSNPDTNNVNFNIAARQGGSLVSGGPINYAQVGNTQVGNTTGGVDGGNYLLTAFFTGVSAPDHNFNGADSAGGLSISFDLAPNINGGGDPTQWGAINLGQSAADKNGFVNGAHAHFGILLRGNGALQAFDGGAVVSGAEMWGPGPNVTNDLHHFELLFTDPGDQNPFDGVGQTDIAAYADGALVYSFSKTGGGYTDNFVNFESAGIGGFDNLVVAQVVPEPASCTLLTLGGLALLRRRRLRLG